MKALRYTIIGILCLLLAAAMCGCNSSVTEFSGIVSSEEELGELDKYKKLSSADLTGSTCYDLIQGYIASHPQVSVKYAVQFNSQWVDPQCSSLTVSSPAQADELISVSKYLKALSHVELTGDAVSVETIESLNAHIPQAELSYCVKLPCGDYPFDLTELDLSELNSSDVGGVIAALPLFSGIERVNLVRADGVCTVSLDDCCRLKAALPDAEFAFSYDVFGTQVTADTETLKFSRIVEDGEEPLGNSAVDVFRKLMKCSDRLKRLEIIDCGIDYELLAQLRDEFPEKQVVWRIRSGWIDVMTDATVLWAIGGLDDEQIAPIKYCTKLEYVDLGHNGFTDISFVYNMPDLKALIIALTYVEDITPLSSCKNLEYLELCISLVDDLTPLAQCDNLQYLNISQLHQITDISPLYGLKNLKRVFGTWNPDIPMEQKEKLKELNPDADIDFEFDCDPLAGRWRLKADGPDEYYLKLIDIFGYPGVVAF